MMMKKLFLFLALALFLAGCNKPAENQNDKPADNTENTQPEDPKPDDPGDADLPPTVSISWEVPEEAGPLTLSWSTTDGKKVKYRQLFRGGEITSSYLNTQGIEAYLLSNGVPQQDIDDFRNLMLE